MPNFVNYDGTEVTKLLLFGTTEVPLDFNLRVRQVDAATPTITYNADEFLEVGGGRYAWVARANIVEFFFTQYPNLPTDRSFSLDELIAEMSANHGYEPRANSGDQFIPLNQYATNAPTDDYAERAYIFGSGAADLTQATFVIAADGTRTIDDIIVQPRADGFDFQSDNNVVQLINDTYLKPTIDPSGLAEDEVVIQWTDASVLTFPSTNGETTTYTQARYEFEKQDQANLIAPDFSGLLLGAFSPNGSLNYIGGHLQADPILSFEELGYWGEPKSVKYLGNGGDDQTIFENADDIILVGNTQNNRFILADIDGSEIYGGSGNDTVLIANIGGHFVDGHDDFDTVEYGNTIATALAGIRGEALGEKLNVSTNSAANLQDLLVNVEALLLTDYDDAFTFSGEFSAIANGDFESVSAGESAFEQMGDTLVLNTTQGVDVDLSNLSASVGPDAITVVGFENVTGSNFADTIRGDGESNEIDGGAGFDIILGGGGADTIDGGAGNDFIVGGAGRDTIDGGSGWDVLSYANYDDGAPTGGISTGVMVDLYDRELDPDADPAENTDASIENIEVFIGSSQGDEFIGSQGGGEWFAGGDGNDTFTISRFASGNGPTVIWGGDGEDTIRITSERYTPHDRPHSDLDFTELGILLVDVPDVTEENFHSLDFADLGLDPGFLYYGFDAIIINHEARDTVFENRFGFDGELPPLPPIIDEGEGEFEGEGGGDEGPPAGYGYLDQEIATVSVTEIISPYVQSLEGFNSEVTLVDRRGFGTDALVDPHVPGEDYVLPQIQRTKTIVADYHTFGIGDVDDGDYQEFTIFGGAAELGLRFSGLGRENTTLRNTSTSVDDFYSGIPVRFGSEEYNALRFGVDRSEYPYLSSSVRIPFDTFEEYPTLTNITDFGGDTLQGTNTGSGNNSWYIVGGSADENGITTAGAPETYTLSTEDNNITERLDALLGRSSTTNLIIDGSGSNDIINTSYQGPNGGSISDEGQTINGFGGNDTITAGAGNDTINGGTQYDTIYAGDGDDVVAGDNGRDTVYLGNGNDIFNDNTQTGTHSLDTVYGGNGEDIINGGGGDDTFYGDSGDDLIYGGDGNDTIYGGSYYDTIHGGAGDDQVWGDNGRDTVYLEAGDDVFNDNTQTGTHSLDTVFGGDGNDVINGGGGDDTFAGDAGDDIITGGIGNDLLSGGTGSDTFLFNDGDGVDVVTDFDFSVDTIEVNGVAVDATALASGVSLVQAGADVTLSYGSGDTVTLQDVDLSAWDGSTGNPVIGQAGTATVTQGNSEQWFTVTFDQAITDAVVVLGPVEFNGSDPTTTRVRNVDDNGFEFQIDEWNYRDGGHIAESVGWLAVSAGQHTLANGVTIAAGVTQVNSTFETVSFGTTLTDAIVLSEVTTVLESDAVTTRHQNVTDTSFDVRLQEEEALGAHVDEDVSWIAIETGSFDGFEAVRTPNQVDEVADQFVFNSTFAETPVLLGDFQTFNGADTSTMRFNDLDTDGVTLRLQEEASRDTELGHTNEVAGYLAIDDGWFV